MCNQEAQRKKCFFLLGNKKCLEKTFMQMFHCKPIELIDQILMARVVCTETVGKKMRFKL